MALVRINFIFYMIIAYLFMLWIYYYFINQSLTWSEAQNFCRVKHTDLATVNSMTHNEILVGIIERHLTNTWIGLTQGETRRWLWSDGIGVPHLLQCGLGFLMMPGFGLMEAEPPLGTG
uniref:C-type lectin domain-containing protein n=1 Tax=Sphaeramia orbicularis TaxID=375764 RepID=A0A673B084_9TELE